MNKLAAWLWFLVWIGITAVTFQLIVRFLAFANGPG